MRKCFEGKRCLHFFYDVDGLLEVWLNFTIKTPKYNLMWGFNKRMSGLPTRELCVWLLCVWLHILWAMMVGARRVNGPTTCLRKILSQPHILDWNYRITHNTFNFSSIFCVFNSILLNYQKKTIYTQLFIFEILIICRSFPFIPFCE